MSSTDLESRILELAQLRGFLSDQDWQTPSENSMPHGQRLAALIRSGRLAPEVVQAIAQELMEVPMFTHPSWQATEGEKEPELGAPLTWKGYTELQPIGVGGGGMVYKALDPQLERWVALKFPRSDQPSLLSRMLREARSQARVDHPCVVQVYEVGEHEGQPFIAMQWIQGGTLRDIRDQLTLEQKVMAILLIAEGLHAAHQLGLVHLDLKPTNILTETTEHGEVRPFLTDFGLVRQETEEDRTSGYGTPGFASPEQLAGERGHLDRRSDVYSLGATLYYLLVGTVPFESLDPEVIAHSEPIPLRNRDPHLPKDLESIIAKCMMRNPSDRYSSARALVEDLRRFMNGEPISARYSTLTYRTMKWLWRNRILACVCGVSAVLLLVAGAWSLIVLRRSAMQMRMAERYVRQVQTVGQLLRMAHLSRLHDRRPTVELVRKAMANIEQDMAKMGPKALGPGSYALGEGYAALGELDGAREYLDRAWNAGFRTPACGQARGLVLSKLYEREKTQIYSEDPATRQKLLERLKREYRDPALEGFRLARRASLNTPYQEAMECFLRDDTAEAIARAESGIKTAPWLYELDFLRFNLQLNLADQLRMEGHPEEAQAHRRIAGEALDRAIEMAPSDPVNWENKGWWCYIMADQPETPLAEQKRLTEVARGAFENCMIADPDHFAAIGGLSQYCRRMAQFASMEGKDPMPYLDKGVEYGALSLSKSSPSDANSDLSWALIARARELLLQNQDPSKDLSRAIELLKRASTISWEFDVLSGLETAYALQGQWAFSRGMDFRVMIQESMHWSQQAEQVEYHFPLQHATTLGRRLDLTEWLLRSGRTPSDSTASVVDELRSMSTTLNRESYVMVRLARALRIRAEEKTLAHQDPAPEFQSSLRELDATLRLEPKNAEAWQTLAEWALAYGLWKVRQHQIPDDILKRGISAARTCTTCQPRDPYPKALESALRLLFERSQGRVTDVTFLEEKLQHEFDRNPYSRRMIELQMVAIGAYHR